MEIQKSITFKIGNQNIQHNYNCKSCKKRVTIDGNEASKLTPKDLYYLCKPCYYTLYVNEINPKECKLSEYDMLVCEMITTKSKYEGFSDMKGTK